MKNWQLFAMVILLQLLLCGCGFIGDGDIVESSMDMPVEATWTPLPTLQPRPSFVKAVSPPESASIPLEVYQYKHPDIEVIGSPKPDDAWIYGYKSQICADIDLGMLVQAGDDLSANAATAKRFHLIVDDVETPAEYVGGIGGAVLVIDNSTDPPTSWEHYSDFCWYVPLGVGIHKVVLRFQQTSGDFQEYAWQFALTDVMPLHMPTPTTTPAGTPVPLPIEE